MIVFNKCLEPLCCAHPSHGAIACLYAFSGKGFARLLRRDTSRQNFFLIDLRINFCSL